MDKQIIFFVTLALFFLFKGVLSMNIILQFSGVVLLLFLIYDQTFNKEFNKKYAKNPTKKFNIIVGTFGNIDLVLGLLLLVRGLYGIIPLGILLFFAILLGIKALPFVFGGDAASVLDIVSVLIIVSLFFVSMPTSILVGISIYLIQKGILTLIA